LIFACLSISFIIGIFIAIPLFNLDFLEIISRLSDITNTENTRLLKYFQIVQSIGLFIIPPFILAYAFDKKSVNYLQINKNPLVLASLVSFITIIISIPIINFLVEINSHLKLPEALANIESWMVDKENIAEKLTKEFLTTTNLKGFFINLFIIAILPAIGEELLFRGVLQRLLIDFFRSKHIGVIIGAIIFSAFHLQFFGFLPRMILGLYLGYILLWSKNLWVPIIVHFTNNASAVIYYYYKTNKGINFDLDNLGISSDTRFILPICVALITGLTLLLYRITIKQQ
jgi:membrane protease YdiL (CAAX protease family)